jgi:hypothetical protein
MKHHFMTKFVGEKMFASTVQTKSFFIGLLSSVIRTFQSESAGSFLHGD